MAVAGIFGKRFFLWFPIWCLCILRYTDIRKQTLPSEVRFQKVVRMLKAKGYYLDHVTGSHHIFENAAGQSISIPVHNKKVKYGYIREIQKLQ